MTKAVYILILLLTIPACSAPRSVAIGERIKLVDSLIRSGVQGKVQLQLEFHLNADMAEMLVDKWSKLNSIDDTGRAFLHYVANRGHTELAEILIAKEANPSIGVWFEGMPVYDFNVWWSPLHFAARKGHSEIISLLLAKGASVTGACFTERFGQQISPETPLHLAAQEGHRKAVLVLISAGADVNADSGYSLPLHLAVVNGHKDTVKLLLDKGADVNKLPALSKFTALHLAVRQGHLKIIEMLIEKGADVNAKNTFGETPLDKAGSDESDKVVKLLLKHGAKTGKELQQEDK